MNRYRTAVYTTSVELPKSQREVFNHLVNLKNWWPEDFEGEKIQLNTEFICKSGDSHYSKNKVIELVPEKKLVWITTESIRKTDNFDWTGTKMIFELEPADNHTKLKLTYDGVVFEEEFDRLVQICDLSLKEWFYNYLMNKKDKM